jgi:uncharacterized membrane protein
MKMDKESLVKNRFWIGLIAFAPLWILIFLVAVFSAGDKAAANLVKVKQSKDDLSKIPAVPKNQSFTTLVAEKQKDLEKQKDKVWAEAWKVQKDLMKWPNGIDNRPQLEAAAYFGDELSPGQRNQFRAKGCYYAQLPPEGMQFWLAPVDANWEKIIHRVDFEKSGKDPTNEEVWEAQEDIWVQQELLSIVKTALDSASRFENVAHFKRMDIPKAELEKLNANGTATTTPAAPTSPTPPATDEPKKPEKTVIVRQRFHNPHWRLDLVLEQNEKKELTITPQTALTSIDAVLPAPGLDIQLWQNSAKPPQPQLLQFEGGKAGEPLHPAKAVPLPGFATNFDDLPLEVDIVADKSDSPLPAGTRRLRYRNPNWELELLITQKPGEQAVLSGETKLTNINATRRTLSLGAAQFRVYQDHGNHIIRDIYMPGEWLGWTKSTTIQKPLEFSYDAKLPLEVMQVFSAYTSPIKRINAFELPGSPECVSFNSHRTANLMLKPATQFPVEAPKEAATGGSGAGAGGAYGGAAMGASGGGGMMGMAKGGGAGAPGGAAGAEANLTPNGINRNRYISVTDQVRHMPIALSLLVEQAHMQDVLTAVTNSRLRIQITQVQWKREEGYKPGALASGGGVAGGMGGGMFPGGSFPGSYMGGSGAGRPGGMLGGSGSGPPAGMLGGAGAGSGGSYMGGRGAGGGSPTGGGTSATAASDQSDPNLIEVAIYGIAALYERYPPKQPAKPEGGGNPGQPVPPVAAPPK